MQSNNQSNPLFYQNKTNIQNEEKKEINILDKQINTLQLKVNIFNKLNSFTTFLQKKSNKKSFYKYRQTLLSIRNKIDLKQRVLNLFLPDVKRSVKMGR